MNGLDALSGLAMVAGLFVAGIAIAEGASVVTGFFLGLFEEQRMRKEEVESEKAALRKEIKRIENDT